MQPRPGPWIWTAWSFAVLGGIGVLVAALLVVRAGNACLPGGPCTVTPPPSATLLVFGGTALAVIGGVTATLLTVRRYVAVRRRGPDRYDAPGTYDVLHTR